MASKIFGNRRSVLYSWIISYICVLFIPILVGVYLYNSAYSVIKNTTKEVYLSSLRQSSLQVDNTVRETNAILGQLLGDEDVQRLSAVQGKMTPQGQLFLITLMTRLQKLITNHPGIEDIYVILGESSSVISTKGYMSDELFCRLYLSDEYSEDNFGEFTGSLSEARPALRITGRDGRDKLLFGKKTRSTGLGHDSGVIVVQWDLDKFIGSIVDSSDSRLFFISDENGDLISSTMPLPENLSGRWETISEGSGETNWTYNYMISTALYEKSARSIQLKTIISLIICMGAGIYLSVRMSQKNYNPIRNLLALTDKDSDADSEFRNEYELLEDRLQKIYRERNKNKNTDITNTYNKAENKTENEPEYKSGSGSTYERFCREVKNYIEENYTDPDLNISQAAIYFDLTPSYLSGIFKKETGVSLLSYISTVRTDAAKNLLKGNETIAVIAEKTGFRDSAALIRTFKKNVGMTPGQYREQQQIQGFENAV